MSGVRRKLSSDESAEYRADAGVRRRLTPEESAETTAGEPGHPGVDQYKTPPQTAGGAALGTGTPTGDFTDALKSAADTAALGAGPQIAGAMGAIANAATAPGPGTSDLDAYRSVRDDTAKDLESSGKTLFGKIGSGAGMMLTPIPVKSLGPGATVGAKAAQGAKVGAGVGGVSALANSKADLTRPTPEGLKKALVDALVGTAGGAAGGGLVGGALGAATPTLRSTAEEQALRAAGLQSGIKNSLKTDLGLQNMTEARQLGRRFLDEKLIPVIGSSEAVGARAEKLGQMAGNDVGATMNKADVATMHTPQQPQAQGQTSAGRPSNVTPPQPGFKFKEGADAARDMLSKESAVADIRSGQQSHELADAFEAQGERTPGSFVGANRAKSDAWKSANFAADAKMSPVLYRKTVGAIRDDIERQVADALGPDEAASLRSSNEKYGVAADALKLAENESQRRSSRKGFTVDDLATIASGGTAGGFAGHPGLGVGTGLAASLGLKAADKYGHSTASRFADFLAKRTANNSGGVVGADVLEPYLELLKEKADK